MSIFLDEINKEYAEHYKYIGELKARYEKRQNRKITILFFSVVIWFMLRMFQCH